MAKSQGKQEEGVTEVKKAAPKKATVTTEVVLGTAAAKLASGVKALEDFTNSAREFVNKIDDLQLQIAGKETRLEELDVEFANKANQQEVDLRLKAQSDLDELVDEALAKSNKIAIKKADFDAVLTENNSLKANMEKTITAEVGKKEAILKSHFENERKLIEANNKADNAKILADNSSLQANYKLLEAQNQKLYEQLDKQREATVSVAEAGSVGTINVGNEGTGKR